MKHALIVALPLMAVAVSSAPAAEITVMSGAAVEAGLVVAVDAFHKQTGNAVKILFTTTPEIRQRTSAGETPDVIIAPPAVLDDLDKAGRVDGAARIAIGRVGVGVAVRRGAPAPDISTTESFKRAVLDADKVIYNRASSGLYVEALLQRLGIAEQIQAKTERYTGTDMVDPLLNSQGKAIGFMPVAEIVHFHDRGMQLVGPLPAEIQNYTSYAAAPARNAPVAQDFVRFLGTPAAKHFFTKAGIE
jgi:molybdate transport system substrate-binding protein